MSHPDVVVVTAVIVVIVVDRTLICRRGLDAEKSLCFNSQANDSNESFLSRSAKNCHGEWEKQRSSRCVSLSVFGCEMQNACALGTGVPGRACVSGTRSGSTRHASGSAAARPAPSACIPPPTASC